MVIAGSPGMAGAAVLTSDAAYRAGAGLVYLCVPNRIADIVAAKQTCAVVRPQNDTPAGTLSPTAIGPLLEFAESCDAVALGPGLALEHKCDLAIRQLVQKLEIPVVADADGVNAFEDHAKQLKDRRSDLILTPHPGELARILDAPITRIQANREKLARATAARLRCTMVLKGHGTVVSDGSRSYVNETGNPGMATGGSGDVLTGIIAALVAQGMKPFEASVLGVHVHGLAGDLAAEEYGQISTMATDILEWVPHAFERHRVRAETARGE